MGQQLCEYKCATQFQTRYRLFLDRRDPALTLPVRRYTTPEYAFSEESEKLCSCLDVIVDFEGK